MFKNIGLVAIAFWCCSTASAQKMSSLKVEVETGMLDLAEVGSSGIFLNVEPKLNVSKNAVIGLRISAALNAQTIQKIDSTQFNILDEYDNGTLSFVPTFDYIWKRENSSPYLGLGIGLYVLGNPIEVEGINRLNATKEVFDVRVNKKVGVLLRGGFERRQLRFGLEYNWVPKAAIEVPNEPILGTVDMGYLGVSIGVLFGAKED